MNKAAIAAIVLQILAALISGFTALNLPTKEGGHLTRFGKAVRLALILASLFSAGGAALDWYLHQVEFQTLLVSTEATRYTTKDAVVDITLSIDKSSPLLRSEIQKLATALEYGKSHCAYYGGQGGCRDFIMRYVVIPEIRFTDKSKLFPSDKSDPLAYGIMKYLGTLVQFYRGRFMPNDKLSRFETNDEDESDNGYPFGLLQVNGATLTHGSTLFEYDGQSLRWFIEGELPYEAFQRAGVLSIVDLLGNSGTASAFVPQKVCQANWTPSKCDTILLQLLRATRIEDIEFRFPHRKNLYMMGLDDREVKDRYDVPYWYTNFPSADQEFHE